MEERRSLSTSLSITMHSKIYGKLPQPNSARTVHGQTLQEGRFGSSHEVVISISSFSYECMCDIYIYIQYLFLSSFSYLLIM